MNDVTISTELDANGILPASTGSPAVLHVLLSHLGRLFRRLENDPTPFVAAISGLAPGGGPERCPARRTRIATPVGEADPVFRAARAPRDKVETVLRGDARP